MPELLEEGVAVWLLNCVPLKECVLVKLNESVPLELPVAEGLLVVVGLLLCVLALLELGDSVLLKLGKLLAMAVSLKVPELEAEDEAVLEIDAVTGELPVAAAKLDGVAVVRGE